MKTSTLSLRLALLSGIGLFSVTGLAPVQAQPDINNAPIANNPANRPVGVQLTAEQRNQQRMRRELQTLGLNQVALQDVVLAFIEKDSAARQEVTQLGQKLQTGLRSKALTNVQITSLLNEYQAAVEEDKVRRSKAQTEFRKAFDFSKYPKVEASLVLMGVFGDGPVLLNNGSQNIRVRETRNTRTEVNVREGNNRGRNNLGGFGQLTPGAPRPQAAQPETKPAPKPAPKPAA